MLAVVILAAFKIPPRLVEIGLGGGVFRHRHGDRRAELPGIGGGPGAVNLQEKIPFFDFVTLAHGDVDDLPEDGGGQIGLALGLQFSRGGDLLHQGLAPHLGNLYDLVAAARAESEGQQDHGDENDGDKDDFLFHGTNLESGKKDLRHRQSGRAARGLRGITAKVCPRLRIRAVNAAS